MAEIGNGRLRGSSSINGDSDLLHPSCKRAKLNDAVSNEQDEAEEEEDRLSDLPDCLLLHILSFLDTKEVVMTCLLSKRWQFIWTDLSVLDLREISSDTAKIRSYVDWVGRMLVMCSGINLSKFFVEFLYQPCFASNVNFWVHYAVKNKVKDITLNFHTSLEKDYYMLPQMLFSCSSLTNLNVTCCAMAPRGAVGWGSLKSLSLYGVILLESVMEKMLSGCPVLEVLCLRFCGGFNHLKISSPNVTTLVIEDWKSSDSVSLRVSKHRLEITSPFVRDLSISDINEGTRYELKDVSSLVRANIDFTWFKEPPKSSRIYIIKLLKRLQSIKELELGPLCTKLLSIFAHRLPPSTLKCLTLNPWRSKDSIPDILGIVKYSPNLETLLIKGKRCGTKDLSTTHEDLDLVSFHVKTIKITQFVEDLSDEPMLTLVRILLERATVLEKMIIDADESIIPKLAVTLLSFPRASPKAVVVFG